MINSMSLMIKKGLTLCQPFLTLYKLSKSSFQSNLCYNSIMTKRQFIFMAFLCSFETYFLNDAILSGSYFFALFWGILLLRDVQRVYYVTKVTKAILEATKKKD